MENLYLQVDEEECRHLHPLAQTFYLSTWVGGGRGQSSSLDKYTYSESYTWQLDYRNGRVSFMKGENLN
jgi:hypothetical protein